MLVDGPLRFKSRGRKSPLNYDWEKSEIRFIKKFHFADFFSISSKTSTLEVGSSEACGRRGACRP